MQKILRKNLESDKNIFDIIMYGSSTSGKLKPRDIDIMVIFLEGSLKERLDRIQNIKFQLKEERCDIKQMLLVDFFKPSHLARTGVIISGVSIRTKGTFAEILGFKPYSLFWYNLSGLSHKEKVKFNYVLAGRRTQGIIEKFQGIRLASGAVKIPIENSLSFEEILKNHNVEYNKKNILEEA